VKSSVSRANIAAGQTPVESKMMTKAIGSNKLSENVANETSEQLTSASMEQNHVTSQQTALQHPLAHLIDRYDGELRDELLEALKQNPRDEDAVALRKP